MLGRWQGDNGDLKRSISNRQLKSPQYQTLAVRSLTGAASASDKVGLCSQIKPTKRFYSRPLNGTFAAAKAPVSSLSDELLIV
jgi:hypothetical protein